MSQLSGNLSPGCLQSDAGRTIGFDLQPLPDGLEPPTSIEPAVTAISVYLDKYLWVLTRNGSISFNRGESPFSTQLCERLSRLFTIPKPHVLEGPVISWVQVVVFAGPSPQHLNQSEPLRVGDCTIQLSEEDRESLVSGRPWRFLDPWPDERDCQRELALVNEDLKGLRRVKDILSKAVESLDHVERELSFRGDLLSQTPNAQPQPSAFESRTSSDISAIEHIAARRVEPSVRKDASADESIGQEYNVEAATGSLNNPPHEPRNSSKPNGSGHLNLAAEEDDIGVSQLSACEVSDCDCFESQATKDLAQHDSRDKLLSTPTPISPFIQKLVE
ncbi:hypothetical protein Asppvi_003829 [Aspergillus pseudoviridinutans]|uniref:Uncharacterized protein n=1 Tax=Aspergillus pseudoviridinutans TaxID=1517512 RepID=A0A9P3BBK4_9EURO|nr:uncharacterized protein Asppvi_003829 [Aspergillus pseudoviridinutans]GIJ84974.1 hypothetical protein Asppvi_003829 [Aspergillus pseudoviridinutans]